MGQVYIGQREWEFMVLGLREVIRFLPLMLTLILNAT